MVAAVAAAVLLALVGLISIGLLNVLQQKRLDDRWTETVAAPTEVIARVAPHGPSPSAVQLVRAAADFGIDLLPISVASRSATQAPRLVQGVELKSWCDSVVSGAEGPLNPVPAEVRAALAERADALAEVIAILSAGEPISWELEHATGGGSGVPAPSQLLELHRWLAAAAVDGTQQNDPVRGSAALEASWQLNQESLLRPERELRIAAYSVLELDLAILRRVPLSVDGPAWLERLHQMDPVAKLDEWVLLDAYSLPSVTKRGTVLDGEGLWPLIGSLAVDPARRWLLMSASESLRVGTASVSAADIPSLDPDLKFVDSHHRIPRWDRLARSALPNPWPEWLSAGRAGLAVHMAAEVLRIEALSEEEFDELFSSLPQRRASRVPGALWMWTAEDEDLRIRLEIEEEPTIHTIQLSSPPLTHLVRGN